MCSLQPAINFPCQTRALVSGVEDSLGGEKYEDSNGDSLSMRAKSPPTRPFFAGSFRMTRESQQQTPQAARQVRESRLARFFSAVFRVPRPFRRQQTVQQQYTVREPHMPMFPCRYPECLASVRGDAAARLGGFCSDTHMW